ncbi:MAG: hypothetical protein LPK14_15060 [Hymenobacteraceae bacterium]|nr:hypothetical protein [Hymenobacteraceae bacterium]
MPSTEAFLFALVVSSEPSRQAKHLLAVSAALPGTALSDLQFRELSAGDFPVPTDGPSPYVDPEVRSRWG